ncbi:MAG: sulfatase-like hydrolase/transferase [Bacteroidota bacterium]
MKSYYFLILLVLFAFSQKGFGQNISADLKPNIVLILVDDSGLMDFGAYGGEAQTPTIDSLTHNGLMFTNMHASPVCAPSRAMLMTGTDSHLNGVANLPEMLPKKYQEIEGYEGVLSENVQTIATRLKEVNYNSYVAGKWHLGHDEKTLPNKRGFDRSFILGGSGADNFNGSGYLPFKSEVTWFEDGKQTELPKDFYSSAYFVDQLIRFHDEEENKEEPFFTFLSFLAVHAPVQAPQEYVEKYTKMYEAGWDELRLKRFKTAKELGILPKEAEMNPTFDKMKKWDELSEKEQEEKITDIAMMAAMLEAMDHHIGRYIQYLKNNGMADNTIFIVTSDNGPDGGDYAGIMVWAKRQGYERNLEKVQGNRYYGFIGPEYASAIAAPFSFYKYYTGEGGLRVPYVMSGAGIPTNKRDDSFCFFTDIAPTIYDIAGISTTANEGFVPVTGKSMLPHIQDPSIPIYKEDEGVPMEVAANSAYFMGDYKIVKNNIPLGDNSWKMYNLKTDPAETKDISTIEPYLFQSMLSRYERYEKEVGVVKMPEGYNAEGEVGKKSMKAIVNPFK